jgi:hypothetical protein
VAHPFRRQGAEKELIEEVLELCTAGQMVGGGLGPILSLPYLPWSYNELVDLEEPVRKMLVNRLRELRELMIKKVTEGARK